MWSTEVRKPGFCFLIDWLIDWLSVAGPYAVFIAKCIGYIGSYRMSVGLRGPNVPFIFTPCLRNYLICSQPLSGLLHDNR